jgi:hypothetical protein
MADALPPSLGRALGRWPTSGQEEHRAPNEGAENLASFHGFMAYL